MRDTPVIASRTFRAALMRFGGYFEPGDLVLYGKYKNKRGVVVSVGKDEKGNPFLEVEPVPKGRKKNKILRVLNVWQADPAKRGG